MKCSMTMISYLSSAVPVGSGRFVELVDGTSLLLGVVVGTCIGAAGVGAVL